MLSAAKTAVDRTIRHVLASPLTSLLSSASDGFWTNSVSASVLLSVRQCHLLARS